MVIKIQQALNEAGYDCGTPDGAEGPATHAAMNVYQSALAFTLFVLCRMIIK